MKGGRDRLFLDRREDAIGRDVRWGMAIIRQEEGGNRGLEVMDDVESITGWLSMKEVVSFAAFVGDCDMARILCMYL